MMESPPTHFDLVSPPDNYTLQSYVNSFAWNPSIDYNPKDEVEYVFWLETGGDSTSIVLRDTAFTVDLDTLGLPYNAPFPLTWWVEAGSNDVVVQCNQRFTMMFPPDGLSVLAGIPAEFSISSVHPNPFNAVTTIIFGADRAERMRLRVFDVSGREVTVLYDGVPTPGWKQVSWNAGRLPTGVYLLRLESPGRMKIAKTAIIK